MKNLKNRSLFATPAPKRAEGMSRRWRVLPIIGRAIKRLCMVLGAVVLFSMVVSTIMLVRLGAGAVAPVSIPDRAVLYLEFEDSFFETAPRPSIADPLRMAGPSLRDYVRAIDVAAKDARIEGIVARMRSGHFELAHSHELRAALSRFRAADKFTHIYSDSYGDAGPGLSRYYLASAFETIWMQPMGLVSISGINMEIPFMRGLLDKLGVTPQFLKRKDYKSAYESFTHDEMSAQNREAMSALTQDLAADLLAEISKSRDLNPSYLKPLVDQGLFTADKALQARLIDKADYIDVLVDDLQEQVLGDRESDAPLFVNLAGYLSAMKSPKANAARDRIALVYAMGAIMPTNPGGAKVAAADDIAPAIFDAGEDDRVKAIVLRVDSPGGSPVASETILRALHVAKTKGKTVIVSMGPVAASGGYWIAANADQIFVAPSTITGSIGVIGGKFILRDAFETLGVNWESIGWGDNSGMWSFNSEFSKNEKARIDMMLDHVYDSFITRVAEGRGMSKEAVDKLAGGRVWSGKAAIDNGLADQAGGLNAALVYAAEMVTGSADSLGQIDVVVMPKPLTPFEQFIELLGGQVALGQWMANVTAQFKMMSSSGVMAYDPLQLN